MAHRAGHEAVAPHRALDAVAVGVAELYALGARDDFNEVRDREAALLLGHFAFGFDDLGIDEDMELAAALADGEVDEHETLRHADLIRREADAGGGVHRVDHVVDQLLQRAVDLRDGLGRQAEDFGAVLDDGKNCHGISYAFFLRVSIIASTVCFARFL